MSNYITVVSICQVLPVVTRSTISQHANAYDKTYASH